MRLLITKRFYLAEIYTTEIYYYYYRDTTIIHQGYITPPYNNSLLLDLSEIWTFLKIFYFGQNKMLNLIFYHEITRIFI